jgi:hypothetical protein
MILIGNEGLFVPAVAAGAEQSVRNRGRALAGCPEFFFNQTYGPLRQEIPVFSAVVVEGCDGLDFEELFHLQLVQLPVEYAETGVLAAFRNLGEELSPEV